MRRHSAFLFLILTGAALFGACGKKELPDLVIGVIASGAILRRCASFTSTLANSTCNRAGACSRSAAARLRIRSA